jgi:hypothetical protein
VLRHHRESPRTHHRCTIGLKKHFGKKRVFSKDINGRRREEEGGSVDCAAQMTKIHSKQLQKYFIKEKLELWKRFAYTWPKSDL